MSGDVIVCYAKCWGCIYGQHYEPAQWHTWADIEDIEANPESAKSRCGCSCAVDALTVTAEPEDGPTPPIL